MPENPRHLFEVFTEVVKTYPHQKAITIQQGPSFRTFDYQEVCHLTIQWAKFFQSQGLQPQDRVAILLGNTIEFPIALWATLYNNAIVVPLDLQYPAVQVIQILEHCQAKLLITTEKTKASLQEIPPFVEVITVDSPQFQEYVAHCSIENQFEPSRDPNLIAAFFYTSGTTQNPKAVQLSHQNLLSNVQSLQKLALASSQDTVMAILPLHHTYAFTTTLLTPLLTGAHIVFPASLNSSDLISSMKGTQATIFVGVPQLFTLMHHAITNKMKDLSFFQKLITSFLSKIFYQLYQWTGINFNQYLFQKVHEVYGGKLRFMISGGARLDPRIAKDFYLWGFVLLEGYGLTEASPVITFNPKSHPKIGSVGKPLADVEVRISQDQPDQEAGEVIVRGPNVMVGYYPDINNSHPALPEGWLHTGDLGYFDHDGYLYLTGRKKELIVLSNGKNIHPDELEEYYSQIPFIKEIAILANKNPGLLTEDEKLVAVIVVNEDYFKSKNETNIRGRLKWELENLSIQLPSYKRIKGFAISREPLPRTRLGKLRRYQLPAIYSEIVRNIKAEKTPDERLHSQYSETSQTALAFLETTFQRKLNPQDHLELDLGLDSLNRVELLLNLQDHLKLKISESQAMEFFASNTIEELLINLQKILPSETVTTPAGKSSLLWQKTLEEAPRPEIQKKIKMQWSWPEILFSVVIIIIMKIFFRIFFFLRIEGAHHLKKEGPYLICPNHTSYLDGLFLFCALPLQIALKTYFVGDRNFFEHPLLRWLTRFARLVPIGFDYNFVESLQTCAFLFRNSKIVCYFPEGQRSIDGEVQEFKKGIGILIHELQIPVIPVYLEGAFHTWPRGQKIPHLAPVKVIFGPIQAKQDFIKNSLLESDEVHQRIAENLRIKVIELSLKRNN
ncbi:MAG: AMP-binding protein [Candidatus Omnitrophica bacterium]|nr:AMP-binding protein [Candidatus Omnitrophota bacterium]